MAGQSHGALGMAKLLTGHEHEREWNFRSALMSEGPLHVG